MSSRLSSLRPDEFIALLEHRNAPPPCIAAIRADSYGGREFFGAPGVTPDQAVDEAFDSDTRRDHKIKPLHIRSLKLILNELLAAERMGPLQPKAVAALAPEPARDEDASGGGAAAAIAAPACVPVAPPPKPSGKKKKQQQPAAAVAKKNDGDDDGDAPPPPAPPVPAAAPSVPISLPKKTANTINNQETQGRTVITKNEDKEFQKLPLPQFATAQASPSSASQQQQPSPKLAVDRAKMETKETAERDKVCKDEAAARSTLKSRKNKDKAEALEDEMLSKAAAKARANSRVCVECKERLPERSFSTKEWAAAAVEGDDDGGGGTCAVCVAKLHKEVDARQRRRAEEMRNNLQALSLAGPISMAVSLVNRARVQEYLRNGGDPNARHCDDPQSILTSACTHGHLDIVRDLLDAGASPNANEAELFSPLFAAAEPDRVAILEALVAHGADVNASIKDTGGPCRSALLVAAAAGHVASTRLLLAAGAAVDARHGANMTPLHIAALNNQLGVVRLLIEHSADVNARHGGPEGTAVLWNACYAGHDAVVAELIKAGADVNEKSNSMGMPPLYAAAQNSCLGSVRLLLAAGADVNSTTKNSFTAMLTASERGHADVVAVLLRAPGLDLEARDLVGQTALYVAVAHQREAVARLLLTAGARTDVTTSFGETPRSVATRAGNTAILSLLKIYA